MIHFRLDYIDWNTQMGRQVAYCSYLEFCIGHWKNDDGKILNRYVQEGIDGLRVEEPNFADFTDEVVRTFRNYTNPELQDRYANEVFRAYNSVWAIYEDVDKYMNMLKGEETRCIELIQLWPTIEEYKMEDQYDRVKNDHILRTAQLHRQMLRSYQHHMFRVLDYLRYSIEMYSPKLFEKELIHFYQLPYSNKEGSLYYKKVEKKLPEEHSKVLDENSNDAKMTIKISDNGPTRKPNDFVIEYVVMAEKLAHNIALSLSFIMLLSETDRIDAIIADEDLAAIINSKNIEDGISIEIKNNLTRYVDSKKEDSYKVTLQETVNQFDVTLNTLDKVQKIISKPISIWQEEHNWPSKETIESEKYKRIENGLNIIIPAHHKIRIWRETIMKSARLMPNEGQETQPGPNVKLKWKGDKTDLAELVWALSKTGRIVDEETGQSIRQNKLADLVGKTFGVSLDTVGLMKGRMRTYKATEDGETFTRTLFDLVNDRAASE